MLSDWKVLGTDKKEANKGSTESPSEERSRIYVDLIDIIFAIIIGVSFTDFKDILVPPVPEFKTVALLLAYVTVVASWVGYHSGIKGYVHRNVGRFGIDLILVYLYFVLINTVGNYKEDLTELLGVFPWIFGFYMFWMLFRYLEYRTGENQFKIREHMVGIIRAPLIFIGSLLVLFYYPKFHSLDHEKVLFNGTYVDWAAWSIMLALVLLYRILPSLEKSKTKTGIS